MMVVDASLALAWCFEDEATPGTHDALSEVISDGGVVPALWSVEVANVLLVATRRGRVSEADGRRALDLLSQLPLELAEQEPEATELLDVAGRHELSAYDALYLAVAMREGIPLGSLDEKLREAAQRAGVSVVPRD